MATQDTTLSDLMLDASYADDMERIHQKRCRQRAQMADCASCQFHAAEVLRTDDALRHYFATLQQGVA